MSTAEERGHVQYQCAPTAHYDSGISCPYCDGGLFTCTRCNGSEGSLPTECPGYKMTTDQNDRVYGGWIDFVGGKWVAYGVRDRDGKMYVPKKETKA